MGKKERNRVVRGILEKSQIPFILSISPEHLAPLIDFYYPRKEDLFNDLFRLLVAEEIKLNGGFTIIKLQKWYKKIFRLQAAILFDYLSNNDLPDIFEPLFKKFPADDFLDQFGRKNFQTALILQVFFEVWLSLVELNFLDLRLKNPEESFDPDRFYKNIIKGQALRDDQVWIDFLRDIISAIEENTIHSTLKLKLKPFANFFLKILPA